MSQISKLVVCGDAQSMVLNFNDKGNLDAVFFAEGDNGRETFKLNPVSHEQPITKEVRQRVFSIFFFESMKSEKGHENMTAVLNQISGEDEAVAEQVIESIRCKCLDFYTFLRKKEMKKAFADFAEGEKCIDEYVAELKVELGIDQKKNG